MDPAPILTSTHEMALARVPAAVRGGGESLLNQTNETGSAEIPISTFKSIHSDLGDGGGWYSSYIKIFQSFVVPNVQTLDSSAWVCWGSGLF